MGFVVRSGIESNDLHELVCRRIGGKKQGAGNLKQSQSFQPFKSFHMFKFRFMKKIDYGATEERAFLQYDGVFAVGKKMTYKRF